MLPQVNQWSSSSVARIDKDLQHARTHLIAQQDSGDADHSKNCAVLRCSKIHGKLFLSQRYREFSKSFRGTRANCADSKNGAATKTHCLRHGVAAYAFVVRPRITKTSIVSVPKSICTHNHNRQSVNCRRLFDSLDVDDRCHVLVRSVCTNSCTAHVLMFVVLDVLDCFHTRYLCLWFLGSLSDDREVSSAPISLSLPSQKGGTTWANSSICTAARSTKLNRTYGFVVPADNKGRTLNVQHRLLVHFEVEVLHTVFLVNKKQLSRLGSAWDRPGSQTPRPSCGSALDPRFRIGNSSARKVQTGTRCRSDRAGTARTADET